MAEIYWFSLREYNDKKANEIYDQFKIFVVEIGEGVLKNAMKFKIKNKKSKLSYADCIGYIYAIENNLLFLTGDKEFEKLKNVEYVK